MQKVPGTEVMTGGHMEPDNQLWASEASDERKNDWNNLHF